MFRWLRSAIPVVVVVLWYVDIFWWLRRFTG